MSILLEAADLLSRATKSGKYVGVCELLEEADRLHEPYELTVDPDRRIVTLVSWQQFGPLIIAAVKARDSRP